MCFYDFFWCGEEDFLGKKKYQILFYYQFVSLNDKPQNEENLTPVRQRETILMWFAFRV